MEKTIAKLVSQQKSIRRAGIILSLLGAVICSSIALAILILKPEITGDLFLTFVPLLCSCIYIFYAARYCNKRAEEFEQGISLVQKTEPMEKELELFGITALSLVWCDRETGQPMVVKQKQHVFFCPRNSAFPHKRPKMTKLNSIFLILAVLGLVWKITQYFLAP